MKKRMIYSEKSECIEDMSRDRVHLNLSYGEWQKLRDFIESSKWEIPKESRLKKKAENLSTMFKYMEELEPIWDKD